MNLENVNGNNRVKWHDRIWQATLFKFTPAWVRPNYITVFRFLTTPIVLYLLFMENYRYAVPAFLFVALTDSADGALARVRNQITEWGKVWDPIADKVLIGSVIYVFVIKYLDPALGAFIILIELAFIFLGWYRLKRGYAVEANLMGKIKMVLQVVGVLLLLVSVNAGWTHLLPFSQGTFYLAIVFAVLSLLTHGV